MAKLKVRFKTDQTLSPDGINPQIYEKGRAYTSRTSYEMRIFEHMIERGKAVAFEENSNKSDPSPTGQKVKKASTETKKRGRKPKSTE